MLLYFCPFSKDSLIIVRKQARGHGKMKIIHTVPLIKYIKTGTPIFGVPIKRLFICPSFLDVSVRSQREMTVSVGKQTPRIDTRTDLKQADLR